MAREWRVGQHKGWNPTTQLLTTYSLSTTDTGMNPTYEGVILTRDPAETDQLQLATNEAHYMLLKRVTTDGPDKWDVMNGVDKGVAKTGDLVPVALLAEPQEWKLKTFKSTSTDGISSSSVVGTRLGVADGLIQGLADSGDGSVALFRLMANDMASDGSITVRVDNYHPA